MAAARRRRQQQEEEDEARRKKQRIEEQTVRVGKKVRNQDDKTGKVLEINGPNAYVELDGFDYSEHQVKFHHYYVEGLTVVK